jgi:FAD/FMN-containing dehydrogenase
MKLPATSMELQKRIKAHFNPNQVLNPGKVFPES